MLAYGRMGFYYCNTYQYKAALDISLKALKLSEQYRIPDYLSTIYYNTSIVYFNLGDEETGLKNAYDGVASLPHSRDPFYDQAIHLYGQIGNMHLAHDRTDSAFYYIKRVDSLASFSKELAARDIANWYWSLYYLNRHQYKKADSVITAGIAGCETTGDFLLNLFYISLCDSYLNQGEVKNAIIAGHQALDFSISISDVGSAKYAVNLLQACYDKKGNVDSAYYFLKVADSLNDVINSKGNAGDIQQIRLNDQIGKKEEEARQVLQSEKNRNQLLIVVFLTALFFFLIISGLQWRNNKQKKMTNSLLQKQNDKIEKTLADLKSTQSQLIQSEKMASLGELTSGIAHEIQNPLNFINNFSEVNTELAEELKKEILGGNKDEALKMLNDITDNENKINHHGKRADAIVKSMLLHSHSGAGKKERTNVNALADEYLRLAFHGMRAKDKSFQVAMETDFDPAIQDIFTIPQDIGRTLLNLFNNAFYAVSEKKKQHPSGYEPTVSVHTRKTNDRVEICVKDNGNGIPQKIIGKIFQPFFTTKPPGQGTGLGLSLSYDIIKALGGELKVISEEGKGAEFFIEIPVA
jgi:two-component system, NtrC family, sensor kinase